MTASVRSSDAASGSCALTMMKPWSSSGTKPPGMCRTSTTITYDQHADEREAPEHLPDQDAGEADVARRSSQPNTLLNPL